MKCRAMETEIIAQCIKRLALPEEKAYGTDIAIIGTRLNQRDTILILGMHVAARGKKLKHEIGTAISDAVQHDSYLIVGNAKGSLGLAELEFMRLHIHPPSAEAHAFRLQTKPLLDRGIPA